VSETTLIYLTCQDNCEVLGVVESANLKIRHYEGTEQQPGWPWDFGSAEMQG
jgi:hypothetical protein